MGVPLPDLNGCAGITGSSWNKHEYEIAVWLRDDYKNDPNTIIHESVHVFQRLCDAIGENAPSAEFEAYTIAHIAETLLKERIAKEQDCALHEERKARLQTGECAVQLEARAD